MKFYNAENLKDGAIISSEGMDITTMGKAFKVLDKKSENKSLDSITDFNFIFLEKGYSFASDENLVFSHSSKPLTFALVSENTIFQIKDKNNLFYASLHEGQLKVKLEKQSLENLILSQSVNAVNSAEEKALNWLNTGRVGMSSATMCASLFPNLKEHHKLKDSYYDDKLEINWPHDNGDFGRCMKFLEAVPEARERLGELQSLSKEWKGLVGNWDKIESLIKEGKEDESYNLIKESLGEKKKLKP